jgi:inner membrane protein
VIAANVADIDVFGWLVGQNYLDFHRGITHALVGAAVLSTAVASIFHVVNRIWSRGSPTRPAFLQMWVICMIGGLTHPGIDFLNDYGIRPWMPFDNTWRYGDLLSIADPWIWIILGSALCVLSTARFGKLAWGALGCLLFAVVCLARSILFGVTWLLVLGACLAFAYLVRRRGVSPVRVSLVVLALYMAGLLAARESVAHAARTAAPGLIKDRVEKIHVLPGRPTASLPWTVVIEAPERFYIADVGLQNWTRTPPAFASFDRNVDNRCYRESLSQEQMAVMARFARFPSVSVETTGNVCTVWLRDLRYARRNVDGWGVARAVVPLSPPPASPGP